jgi:hypothetical protein
MFRPNCPSSGVYVLQSSCYCRVCFLGWYGPAAMYVLIFTFLFVEFVSCSGVWQFFMCSFAASDASLYLRRLLLFTLLIVMTYTPEDGQLDRNM